MEIIENKARENMLNILEKFYNPESIVLFDIETTGFVAQKTKIYLIGCVYFSGNNWLIKQWFNNDGESEKEIISKFMEFIKSYQYILHFNGDGFDIPYIEKKLESLGIKESFDKIESIDIYKLIKPFKDILHLDNLKQKSIENYLSINRLDKYSGGDLIKVYQNFLKKYESKNKKLLLQHNYEDLEGLLYITSLISLCKFKNGCFNILKMSVKNDRLLFYLNLEYELPKRLNIGTNSIIISAYKNEATISVPIITDTLKFFFDDYKEYYYLPAEDMAVHKSVATYVDKDYRQPAKKNNCYVKKNGHFITQINKGILAGYKYNFNEKETYIELVDSFLKDTDMINSYLRHIVKILL